MGAHREDIMVSVRRLLPCIALSVVLTAGVGAYASPEHRVPLLVGSDVVYGDLGPASSDVRATAAKALRRWGVKLHVEAARFTAETVRTSILGTHVRGRAQVMGVPIDGTASLVTISHGRVVQVEAHDLGLPGLPARHVISAARAIGTAVARVLAPTNALVSPRAERLLVADRGRLRDTWRIFTLAKHGAARVDVDAATGRVWQVTNAAKMADGTAMVYDPNPIVTLRDNTLRDPSLDPLGITPEQSTARLDGARRALPLRDVDPTLEPLGQLSGPWVRAVGALPQLGTTLNYTRSDPRFVVAMEYTHIDRYQRYLQDVLGFKGQAGVNDDAQLVLNINDPEDNSFYQPGNDFINFGVGGVDDAEDAEVILHEYGHAVQDAQVPGWGATEEGGAMGEGFGDFEAAAYFARTSGGFQDDCVADWDSTTYSTTRPPCLRRMDSSKIYPEAVKHEVHDDGEMWSALLWRVRAMLAKSAVKRSDLALKLVIASQELQTTQTDFAHGEVALKQAARMLGHKEWVALIDKAAAVGHMPNAV